MCWAFIHTLKSMGFPALLGYNMDKKPKCKLIGEDGNIFNLVGIAARTLRQNGMEEQAKELCERLKEQPDYDHALMLIAKYVDIV